MKNYLLVVILMSLLRSAGCTAISPTETPNEETETVVPSEPGMQMSSMGRVTAPEVTDAQMQALAGDNTAFALDFYNQIRSEDGNIIYSPFSISVALAMTMAGAEGATETAMLDALKMSLPADMVYPAYDALLLAIESSEEGASEDMAGSPFILNIANSIWGQSGFAFKEPFLNTLSQYFGAGIYTVDYVQDPEAARQAINGWVEDETMDKIKDLIPEGAIDQMTRLVLANAIYFKGSWYYPFNEGATAPAEFNLLDGSQTEVDMMTLTGEHLMYAKGNGYQVVQLPYMSSDFVMTIIVPDEGNFEAIEAGLTADSFAEMTQGLEYKLVDLQMPKYDFETSLNVNDVLIALGMGEAFDPGLADFSGMTDEDRLFISDVLHKQPLP